MNTLSENIYFHMYTLSLDQILSFQHESYTNNFHLNF